MSPRDRSSRVKINAAGQASFFMALTAILPGRTDALREHLEALPPGPESPLAKLEQVHFGRWVIVSGLVYFGPPQKQEDLKNDYLLFVANVDAPLERFIDAMRERMAGETDAVWGHCVGYPGTGDREAFLRYMRHNQIDALLPFAQYQATVPEVRDALALRDQLIEFAIRAQELDGTDLQEAYRQEFAS